MRLLVCDKDGGVYGASYKWRADDSDAELVKEGRVEPAVITTATGTRTQNWYYPGPEDCRKCHTPSAGGVLGVNTRQLNRDYTYPSGVTDNQVRAWNHVGLFDHAPAEQTIPNLTRLVPLDDPLGSLGDRARSFLDVNCAYCHRPGGAAADFDARFDTPLARQLLINVPRGSTWALTPPRYRPQ